MWLTTKDDRKQPRLSRTATSSIGSGSGDRSSGTIGKCLHASEASFQARQHFPATSHYLPRLDLILRERSSLSLGSWKPLTYSRNSLNMSSPVWLARWLPNNGKGGERQRLLSVSISILYLYWLTARWLSGFSFLHIISLR